MENRYCLKALLFEKTKGIYWKEYLYPGNDTKPNNILSKINNHFRTKPKEVCYVCLYQKGDFYHFDKYGFPGNNFLNKASPKCLNNIRLFKKDMSPEILFGKRIIIIKYLQLII